MTINMLQLILSSIKFDMSWTWADNPCKFMLWIGVQLSKARLAVIRLNLRLLESTMLKFTETGPDQTRPNQTIAEQTKPVRN